MAGYQRQVLPLILLPFRIIRKLLRSRHLGYARGLHYRRALLAIGKACGFFFVGVHAAKLFAVGVKYGNQPVVVLAAAIPIEGALLGFGVGLGGALGHGAVLFLYSSAANYRKQM